MCHPIDETPGSDTRIDIDARSQGHRAFKNLVKFDKFDNLFDLYLGMASETGLWDDLSGSSKTNFIQNAIKNNDSQWIFDLFDYISQLLRTENDRFAFKHLELNQKQIDKLKKNTIIMNSLLGSVHI